MEYIEIKEQIKQKLPVARDLGDSENLLELGLSSLTIMRLVNQWRKQGVKVSFGSLMENPTLEGWWALIQRSIKKKAGKKRAQESKITPEKDMKQPFPLTDVQYAYWVGRDEEQALGGIDCHAYLEFDGENIDPERLEKAWNVLQYHHPMLRACFLEDGTQKILDKPYCEKIKVHDFSRMSSEEAEAMAVSVRERLSHRKLKIEEGEVAGIELTLFPENKARLHVDMALLVADVQSLQILLRDLAAAYRGESLPAESKGWNFASYLERQKEEDKEEKNNAEGYWKKRLEHLPKGPGLPLAKRPQEVTKTVFNRRIVRIGKEEWAHLQVRAKEYQTTPAMVLLTAYATVLERWSRNHRFLINIPFFNRKTEQQGLEEVIADFTTLLLLEINCEENPTFAELLDRIQRQLHEDMKYTAYSGVQVQRDLAQMYGDASAVAPVVFACNLGTPLVNDTFRKELGQFSYMISQTPQVWNDFQSYEDENGVQLTWDSVDELFPENMIPDMLESFEILLHELGKKDWNQRFDVFPERQKQFVEEQKKIRRVYKPDCIHSDFFNIANTVSAKVAIIDTGEDITLSYGELSEKALSVAAFLIDKNIKDQPIAISTGRGWRQAVAALGILTSCNLYVPVTTSQPEERRKLIHEKTGIQYVITDKRHYATLTWPKNTIVWLIEDILLKEKTEDLPKVTPEDAAYIIMTSGTSIEVQDVVYVDELFRDQKIIESAKLLENTQSAYVIYTSGSTGEPKGVEISHESVMNTILDMNERLSITENDVFIAISKMNFDLSIYDMFGCLIAGATLVIPDDDTVNPERWAELINHYGVTIWNSVPALMQILFVNEEAKGCKRISSLRNILLSGDWIPIDLPARIYEFLPDTRIISLGGATEASIWSVYHECNINEQYKKSIPYGKPLSNQTLYIWDENMRDCPIGVKGDLFIGGIGLAKGYMNSSDLTAQKFIVKGGERFYRTGDKGRYLLGGEIEFLGREDMQVKINGYRIELGEIESILCNYEPVYQAVVSVIKNKLLVAAVVFHNGSNASEADILIYLKMHLPQYMIPKKIVVWDSFPLTFNGKIDRKRIDENYSIEEMQKHMEGMSVDNNSANELLLMWREALHNSEIQLQDNLYDYGVDSLIMAQMASKIRNNYTKNEIPFDVLLRQLLNHPDVLSLYQYIENYSMPDKKLVQNIKNDGIGTINIFHENKNDTLQVLLHAGFGTMNCFRYLIEYMRLDNKGTIAGIAIKNSKRYCEMNPDNLIEILADEYVNLIIGLNKKKIQIIGYCISGLIAVEIARRLMERGLEIFDLVLIDSHPIQYQLEDELLMEITFLPSLGIEISQLGLGEISNEELYKAVLYLYNEFKKEIPSRSIQYLPDEYINLKKILLKLDCMEKRQRFELYSKMALEKAENQFPVDMCIDLFATYKQSFKAAQFVPEVYAGNIRFLLAEESTSFIPDNDEETLAFWKNTCLDDMSVEMIKGNHITCTENKENACTLCKKISKCFQD